LIGLDWAPPTTIKNKAQGGAHEHCAANAFRPGKLVSRLGEFGSQFGLIGESETFRNTLEVAQRISRYDVTTLLRGETGTGKELFARAMHYGGPRQGAPFIPVNAGAITDSLFESELFGHVKGSFTHATETRPGLIEQADGGTLFLDEIEALTPHAQVGLLRFLQDRQYRPVGGKGLRTANVRIIAATNVDLRSLAGAQAWREDLIYRFEVVSLTLPPLRERGHDVVLLAEEFCRRFARNYSVSCRRLHPDTVSLILNHDWPGNVRELENLIHRNFLLSDSEVIRLRSLAASTDLSPQPQPQQQLRPLREHPRVDTRAECFRHAKARAVAAFERAYLVELLRRCDGNVSKAARIAGKERSGFSKLVRKHGLKRSDYLSL
jgi:DNA-binding NtrC family response regulator